MKYRIHTKLQIGIILVLLGMVLATACTPTNAPEPTAKPEQMKLYIGPEKVDCEGEGPMKCLLVKFEDDSEWTLFYGNIEGFEYEPGFEYELEVTRTELENPPAGGLSIKTELVRIVSKLAIEEDVDVAVEEPVDDGSDEPEGMADPASEFCVEQGGTLETRTEDDIVFGVCIFDDGSECEVWAFFLGRCQQEKTDPLMGSDWDLVSYGGQTHLPDTSPTIQFTVDGTAGSTGCNRFFGTYILNGAEISIGPLGSTLMACEGLMEQETAILGMLGSAESFTLEADALTIHTPQGDLVYKSKQDLSLESKNWILSGISLEKAIVSTWVDEAITAEFKDGEISGFGGCNNYFGAYETDGESLTLGPIGSTRMLCEDEVNQREMEFFAALESVKAYSLSRKALTLLDPEGNTLITFQAQTATP